MKDAVSRAIEAAQYAVENETDVAVGQIELLERVTHNSKTFYLDATERLGPTFAAFDDYVQAKQEFCVLRANMDSIEQMVQTLEEVATELDQWSSELQVKTRRLQTTS